MKVNTSITLSDELLERIDRRGGQFKNRSVFLDVAAKAILTSIDDGLGRVSSIHCDELVSLPKSTLTNLQTRS